MAILSERHTRSTFFGKIRSAHRCPSFARSSPGVGKMKKSVKLKG